MTAPVVATYLANGTPAVVLDRDRDQTREPGSPNLTLVVVARRTVVAFRRNSVTHRPPARDPGVAISRFRVGDRFRAIRTRGGL